MNDPVSITKEQLVELMSIMPKAYRPIVDIAVPVGFRFKLFGIDWRTSDQLADLLMLLYTQGILELHPSDRSLGRLSPKMYCLLPAIDSHAATS